MIQQDSLARHTLDTLPFNIAVLDSGGTILFTNRAWREFAGIGGDESGEMVGVNYFASMDTDDDDAAQALSGLKAVIDGEQEVFTLEYPCHSEDEKRWFLMRAAALPEYDAGSVVVAHIDITQRKLAEIRAREKREHLEHLMHRIDGLVENVMAAVVQANTHEAVQQRVCERLVDVDAYTGAWVGELDLRTEQLVPAHSEGVDVPASGAIPLDAADPTIRTVETGEPQVRELGDEGSAAPVHEAVVGDQEGALAAFPLVYNDTEYGVLTVYASEPNVFDERELAVLQVLARFASTAINAIEGRRILTTDQIVEVELAIDGDEVFFGEIAAAVGCEFEYEGALYEQEGSAVMVFVSDADDPEQVVDIAEEHPAVERATHVSDSEARSVFEFAVDEPPVVASLAERGAETTAISAGSTGVRVTAELPTSADPRSVIEQLSEEYPSTELLARRERERSEQTHEELVADIEETLTARQELALRKAHLGGFFEWPREVSGEELAESMDITPSTYHQHLRAAERKVLSALLEE